MQEQWDPITRLLHWIIVLTVSFQLFSSLVMASPSTQFLFPIHEYVGLASAATIFIFWMYSFAAEDWPILFPWNRAGMAKAWSELTELLHGRLPKAGRRIGLSGFVHGLGLLALTASAITGVFIYLIVPGGQHANPGDGLLFTRLSLFHAFFGELIWLYWIGHAALAILHQVNGSRIFRGIFGFSRITS